MAVTEFYGFETGHTLSEGLGGVAGTIAISTGQARTGSRSLRINPASGAAGYFSASSARFTHFGLYVASLPSVARVIAGANGANYGNLLLNPDGTISVRSGTSVIGTSSAAFASPGWHWVGWANIASRTGVLLQIDGADEVSGTSGSQSSSSFGCNNTEASAIDFYADDLILDNAGFLAPSKVGLLLPVSEAGGSAADWVRDNNVGSGRYLALGNTPPTGIADTTSGDGSHQVRDGTSGLGEAFTITTQTYASKGIVAADTLLGYQLVLATGAASGTSPKNGSWVISNPTLAKASFGTFYHGSTNAGTFPTGWVRRATAVGSLSGVTLSSGASVTISQETSSTRVAMVCFIGLAVAWTPDVGVTGDAASSFGWSDAASGKAGIRGPAASLFGWSDSASGKAGIRGPAASAFGWSDAAAGQEQIAGSAASSFGFSTAAAGTEEIAGDAASEFGWSTAAAGAEAFTGTAASAFTFSTAAAGEVMLDISGDAASAFGWSTAGEGESAVPPVSGDAASAFGWSTAAAGLEQVTGTASSTWPFGTAAEGKEEVIGTSGAEWGFAANGDATETVPGQAASLFTWSAAGAGLEEIAGAAASAFGFATSGAGQESISGPAATAFGWSTAAAGVAMLDIDGVAASSFGWSTAGEGESAVPPVDGDAASSFGWSTGAVGAEVVTGTAGSAFAFSTAALGLERIEGAGASTFGFASAGAAILEINGAGGSGFGFGTAGTGAEQITGTGAGTFGWSTAAVGFADIPETYSNVTFGWSTAAAGFLLRRRPDGGSMDGPAGGGSVHRRRHGGTITAGPGLEGQITRRSQR